MAKTASTGFFLRKSLASVNNPTSLDFIIADSATIKVGDAVRISTAGYAKRAAAGEVIGGVCIGLVDQNGVNVFSPRAAGITGSTLTPDDQLAVSSTNTSDATRYLKAQIAFDPAGNLLWFNDSDGSLAQTNLFQFFDSTAAGNQITSGGASDANGQWQLIQIDPDGDADLSKGLFRINESQFSMGIDTATAKNTS